jgi:hypothetical protein
MIARLSGRVAAILAGAVVLVVLVGGWFVFVSPQRSKAASLSTQIDATQAQVASTQAYVDSPATKQAVHDLVRLKKVMPDDPRISQVLRQLSAASASSQVALNTISPGPAIASSGGEAIPISITVTGHYFNIARFLNLLRASADVKGAKVKGSGRLFSVDSIQFSGGAPSASGSTSGATGGSSAVSASLALNTFVYSSAAVAPPAADTSTDATTTTSP